MNPWRPFPLVRLVPTIVAGCMAALLTREEIHVPVLLIIVLLFIFGAIVFIPFFSPGYRMRWFPGAIIFLLTSLFSYELSVMNNDLFYPGYFVRSGNSVHGEFMAVILDPASVRQKSVKVYVRVIAVCNNGRWKPVQGRSLIYLGRENHPEELLYGETLLFRCTFHEPQRAAFPYSFDQKAYLERKHIRHTAWVKAGEWRVIDRDNLSLQRLSLEMRNRLLRIMRENGISGREFAVAAALLLGYVDEIDRELIHDYSATGAMHILSVSGMHVGIIFLALEWLLGFLGRSRRGALLKAGLIIVVIWFYAMMTGMSPAVLRASVMITLVVAGKSMKRDPDILNIVAASFIVLVLHDATLLNDVGFEMSYLAVAGIVLLYKPVYDLYSCSHYLTDKIWSIVAVSLAAQLVTFPLGLFYFHQFPNYFMIANIIVVPLSTLVIYSGIILLALGMVPVVPIAMAKLLSWQVWGLNQTVHFIEELPWAVTKGIYITEFQTILIYTALVALLIYLTQKNKVFFIIFLFIVVLFTGNRVFRSFEITGEERIIVYGSKGKSGIELISGNRSLLICSPDAVTDSFFTENRQAGLTALGIRNSQTLITGHEGRLLNYQTASGRIMIRGNFILAGEARIGLIMGKLPHIPFSRIRLDCLVMSGNPLVSLDDVARLFDVKEIIADPSNAGWRVRRWKEESVRLGLKLHDAAEEGAWIK